MNQTPTRLPDLPLVVALFDGDDDGNNDGQGGTDAQGNADGQSGNQNGGHNRNDRGQFSRADGNRTRDLPADLNEAHRIIVDLERRISDLNTESSTRRRENKDLKKDLTSLQSRQTLVDQRAIRMEAREALRSSGVIDPDVVDLFLKHAGESIKIDATTGDVVGVEGALSKFKEAKPVFFKAADAQAGGQADGQNGAQNGAQQNGASAQNGAGAAANGAAAGGASAGQNGAQGAGGQQAGADNRGNATGTGASVNGGGNGDGQGGFKVANFRDKNVNATEAFERYKRSLR